jgi:DNA-binding Lrp family transcriptional regulator
MPELSKLDKDILFELSEDCRQSDASIGKKLRRSKQTIRYRIKRLEEQKIITAYNALIDFRVLGLNSIRVYFKLRNISPEKEKEMYEYIRKSDLFLWTVNLEGDVDIAFYVWIKDIDQFYEKWEDFFHLYRQYIHRQEFYISINMIHYPMKILKKPAYIRELNIGENKKRLAIDETDLKILKILSRQANLPATGIAKEASISAKQVIYRIRRLEKEKIILGYNAILDETKLGYSMFKIDFYLFNHSRLKEMYEFAKQHPNIKNVMRTIGGADFEIEVLVRDVAELRGLIEEIREKYSEVIDYWRYNRFVKTIKQVYLPVEIDAIS